MKDSHKKLIYFLIIAAFLAGLFLLVREKKQAPAPDSLYSEEYKKLIGEGHEFYKQGKYAQALELFQSAAKENPNDRIYFSLYSTYLALEDYPEAEKAIKMALSLNQFVPLYRVEYASFLNYYMNGSFETVSGVYLDALKKTNNHIDLLTSYAAYLAEKKRYGEAIKYLEKAKTADPARGEVFQKEIDYLRSRM